MREILFRGKAINRAKGFHRTNYKNGEWVYGLVTKLYDERFKNLPAEMTNTYGVSGIDVDYKTIGQYTGLTDKNGKKIFEGDILERKHKELVNHSQTMTVKYIPYKACFSAIDIGGGNVTFISDYLNNKYELEVIGNIYDNPELLGL